MRKASVRVSTRDAVKLEAVLRPEGSRPLPRTKVSVRSVEGDLLLEVTAQDTSALRAALNSYLRWTSTALKMMEEAKR